MCHIFKLPISLYLVGLLICFVSACTKADYDDDFKPATPPPLGNYNTSDDVSAENLIAKWTFDETVTESKQNLTGTNTSTTFTNGIKGKAFQGAANGYVVYNNPGTIVTLQSFTVSFWMKAPPTGGNARGIFSLNNQADFWGNLDIYQENFSSTDTAFFKVHINNDNAPSWKGQFTDAKIGAAINRWVHMAVTYDAATSVFNIYANGAPQGVSSGGNPPNTRGPILRGADPLTSNALYGPLKFVNATAMVIGTWQFQTNPSLTNSAGSQSWAGNFTGALDEFRIYKKALTAQEVTALYQLEKQGR
jgi:hypothetical protein